MLRGLAVSLALVLAGTPAAGPGAPPRKLALIVAISAYPAESGYPRINAGRDVGLVRGALLTQGFDSTNIRIVEDSAATREGILAGIDWLADRAGPGDAVVVHYSGHGHRISDDNGDEVDGFDEILVPYGAPNWKLSQGGPTYHGERHIRDDELGVLLARLRAKVGPSGSVTVFLDACYSGSATRGGPGELAIRGVAEPIIVPDAPPPPSRGTQGGEKDGSGAFEPPATRGEPGGLGALVVISAARHDQVARETYDADRNPVGSLSLALSRALPRLTRGESYRALFDRIAELMAGLNLGDQRPQIEGSVDTQVFSGQIIEQTAYYQVAGVEGDTIVRVKGGMLLGLLPGTRIEFHPSGTADPRASNALASGIVANANEGIARVALDRAPAGAALTRTWAFVTEYGFADLRLRVRVDPALPGPALEVVRRALGALPVVQLAPDKPDLLIHASGGGPASRGGPRGQITLATAPEGSPIGAPLLVSAAESEMELRERVLGFARGRTLRRLELADPGIHVRLEMVRTVPRIHVSGSDTVCSGAPPVALGGSRDSPEGIVLTPGEEYTLRFSNEGRDPAYLTVLDLLPDGRVQQLFPLANMSGNDNYLPPGKSYLIPDVCFFAEPPYGVEVIKLFATRERFDFRPILTGGITRGEPLSPLGQLLADAYQGLRSSPVPATGWGTTAALSLTIKPKASRP